MIDIKTLVIIFMTSAVINNYVLSQFLGICPFLGVSKKLDQAMGMSIAVIFVMLMATAVTWPVQTFLLTPKGGYDLGYLQTIVFILVIAALVQLVEIALKKYAPALHAALGIYLPLITTNCAVLGVCINNIDSEFSFIQAMVNALGAGMGFMLALVLFSGVRGRIEGCEAPESFQGLPITLVAASIASMSFFGFAGVVENLFG